jgi:hypothetical protein
MNKESYFDLVIESTPEPSHTSTKWATHSKLGMLFIEFRTMDIIKYNLWNIANVYGGGDTVLTIVHSGENKDMIMETTKDWENVRYIQAFESNKDVNAYSKLLVSYEFWDNFSEFEHILINQWDSYIFKKIPEHFFEYDFVGAPTGHYYIQHDGRIINICSSMCKCDRCVAGEHPYKENNFITHPNKIFMFNGGFSLRNVSTMKEMCRAKPWRGEAEDLYFMMSAISRPTRDIGRSFSVQDFRCEGVPVGCHQIWLRQDEEYIRDLFKGYR